MRLLSALLITLAGCASPGYQMTIPPQVAAALAGADPASVDPMGPPMVVEAWWYDRDVHLVLQRGDGHSVEILTVSDAGTALEAHQADVGALAGLAELGRALAALAVPVPPAAASP